MSNDVAFSPLAVPVLTETEQEHAALAAARSRGFAAGYADGRREAGAEQAAWAERAEAAREAEAAEAADRVAVLSRALRTAAVELREATVPVVGDVEETLVSAAFELAEAVVGAALADRVTAARGAVERVLTAAAEAGTGAVPVIRLNPSDAALLATEAHDAVSGAARVVPDAALAPGDAIGELPDGWLDARIHSALQRAKEALS